MMPFNDTKLRIIGPLVVFVVGTLFFRLNWYFEQELPTLIRSDLIALGSGYICWHVARWIVLRLQRRYPGLENTRRRLLRMGLLLPGLIFFAWLIRQLAHMAMQHTSVFWPAPSKLMYAFGIQIFYHCIYFVIYEGAYVLRQWQQTHAANELVRKKRLQSQLDLLKSQINPHFLFNSLNSLSALIAENPARAELFVDEISSVYRYLLRTNDRELTPLRTELAFIESYFNLLKTRYGNAITWSVSVQDQCADCLIPPLTLQLLVENAVKHNVILPEQPLTISICVQNGQLLVRNTLQRKSVQVASNRVGLANIAAKYDLLGKTGFSIHEDNHYFTVSLPLLTPVNQPA